MSNRSLLYNVLPKLLPHGLDQDKLLGEAKAAANTMTAMFFVQLGLQVCLKGILDDLWVLYFTLQIICYLQLYDVPLPPNADIYIKEFTKLIEFDILHPDTVGKFVTGNDDFKIATYLQSKLTTFENAKDTTTILEELSLILIAFLVFLVFVFGLGAAAVFKPKVRELIKKLANMVFFNAIIRSITIVYINLCMAFALQVENHLKGNKNQSSTDYMVGLVMFSCMMGYPILTMMVVAKYKAWLDSPKLMNRIGNLYSDIRLKGRYDMNLMYYTLFLLRRIVFVAIPTFLYKFPFYQIQVLMFLTSCYILFYAGAQPHIESRRRQMEVFNEWMVLVMIYHLVSFSEFNMSNAAQFNMGYSYIMCLGIVVFVNLFQMMHKMFYKWRTKYRLLKIRKFKLKQIQDAKDAAAKELADKEAAAKKKTKKKKGKKKGKKKTKKKNKELPTGPKDESAEPAAEAEAEELT